VVSGHDRRANLDDEPSNYCITHRDAIDLPLFSTHGRRSSSESPRIRSVEYAMHDMGLQWGYVEFSIRSHCGVIRSCGELPRQAGEIFPKLPGYENKHSTSSNHICTRLLCGHLKHASGKSGTGWRLFGRKHGGGAKFPFEPYERHLQHGNRNIFASNPHRR
jgi:hypothetical protein